MPTHHRPREDPRKASLATQYEMTSTTGTAFERMVADNGANVLHCRHLLLKPVEMRNVEDVHMIKLFFNTSKIGKYCTHLDLQKESEFYKSLQLQIVDTANTYVFRQGDMGDKFYVIFSGTVQVRKSILNQNGDSVESAVCELRPGDCFGDRALTGALNETLPREASIMTISNTTELAFMDKLSYSRVMRDRTSEMRLDMPKVAGLDVTKRFRSNKDIVRAIFLQPAHERTERDLKFAVEYLKGVKFFARFSFEVRKQLCKALRLICAWTNTVVFEEGHPGYHFYIIFCGSVEVLINTTNRYDAAVQSVVSMLKEGETFGELALSEEDGTRRATVVATEYTEFLTLSRDEYIPLIQKYQNQYHTEYVRMLQQNPYFTGDEWDLHTLEAMCSVMVEKYVPFRGTVCEQGSRASEMFVVVRGECVAQYETTDPFTNEALTVGLGRFGPNSVIGCAEATAGKFNDVFIRPVSVVATSPVKVLVLSRFDIFHLLTPEARDGLQRWSYNADAETLDARVLKTIVWEKYRSNFIADSMLLSSKPTVEHRGVEDSSQKQLQKHGHLPPVKQTTDIHARKVVDSGELQLVSRPRLTYSSSQGQLSHPSHHSSRQPKPSPSADILILDPTNTGSTVSTTATPAAVPLSSSASMPALLASLVADAATPPLVVSAPAPRLPPASMGITHFNPKQQQQSIVPSTPETTRSKTPISGGSHPTRQFLWSPLHGVYQPYAVVGFGRPVESAAPVTFRVCGKFRDLDAALRMFHDVCKLEPTPVNAIEDHSNFVVYKDGDVSLALRNMDRSDKPSTVSEEGPPGPPLAQSSSMHSIPPRQHLNALTSCALNTGPKESRLRQKRHSVVLTTSSSPNSKLPSAHRLADDALPDSSTIVAGIRQEGDPDVMGQRFACIGLKHHVDDDSRDLHVHVYHCFPTHQSAIRHSKQLVAMLNAFADNCLYVVPLFDWIHRQDLERYEARNPDLDSLLDGKLTISKFSGWKARKDAVRKRQGHIYHG
ncbi:hypothetical protein H257_00448 [Aphanomyces astaci]|uniref:Cyclic nucleotide-binding domain-containing protein n=1 Tax=Aphanomyces astaci TaxID=112090 RepID=W4HBX7_APHAT|nr:hypothetical protein H257_00448 [Aphanomyces astaci]ETV89061.1 hypothetical protein H257_00448 [Aphanomyces astaci]|eukprot:XP_009821461.1 hypothetical protein H257_00448 [Aphanomyces astaci]